MPAILNKKRAREGHAYSSNSPLFRGPTESQVTTVEDNESGLEGHIAEDGEANVRVALDAAEANRSRVINGGKVDVASGDHDARRLDAKREGREGSTAAENIATLRAVVPGAADLCVIGRDDGGGEQEQRGAGVSNAGDGRRLEGCGSDLVTGRGEGPEAVAVVDIGVGNGTLVGGLVNVTKVVLAS